MRRYRALSFLIAALTGAVSGLPVDVPADDTEIYVGDRAFSEGVRPNLTLILDTSGSMAATDGEPLDRLDRVKTALNRILDEVDNVNIGLMRFHTPGGPVLFPTSFLDDDSADVEKGLINEVNVRITGSENDAEQIDGGANTVVLDSTQLELAEAAAFGTEMSTVASVGGSSDDAEQQVGGAGFDRTRKMMDCCVRVNGLRFRSLPIPPNSTIVSAEIEFIASKNDTSATTMTFNGHLTTDAPAFSAGANDVVSRPLTAATVTWSDVPDWDEGSPFRTPNLKSIVQEIVGPPGGPATGWAAGNSLAIVYTGAGARQSRTFDNAASDAARLFLEWIPAGAPTSVTQIVGLRFQDVRIPQGQAIQSAFIEFVPREDAPAAGAANLRIRAEAADDSAAFTTTANDIGGRTPTVEAETWTPPAWKAGVAQQTPDLTDVLQEVVNRPGWCGGNDLSFIIDSTGATVPQIAASADGDGSLAPILRVDFDRTKPLGPGEGCTIHAITSRVSISSDDADQEVADPKPLDVVGGTLELDADHESGLRFQAPDIPAGVEILDARLVFTADGASSGPVTLTFEGQTVDTATTFSDGAGTDVLTRTPRTPAVSWTPPAWSDDETHTSPNLAAVVDGVVNGGTGWVLGSDLAILMRASGAGQRIATSYDGKAANAPQLRVLMRANIGDLPSIPVLTVRQRLKQIVNELDHRGTTPIVDTLYEAAVYFRGEKAKWGLTRGTSSDSVRRTTRVSHPASYVGGTVVRDPGCTDLNLNADECVTEEITGDPDYISPITTACQSNFIVLLTDGLANRNSSKSLIQSLVGKSSCDSTLPGGGGISSAEECGIDLVRFLADETKDQNPDVPGPNSINTYTIGLKISNDWLKKLAEVGGGTFFEAGSTTELVDTFNAIVADVLERTSSFSTPSLSVNSFNRLFHLNEVYFSLFEPKRKVAWPGNVKKYEVREETPDPGVTPGCPPAGDPNPCAVGDILDATGKRAIGLDGRIVDDAVSFWDTIVDGAEVLKGGAGNQIPAHADRRVFTFTDPGEPTGTGAELVTDPYQLEDVDGDGILDGLVGSPDARLQRTKDLLGWPGPAVATLTAAEKTALAAELNEHIRWIRGEDVDDLVPGEDRFSFTDPLHGSAVAVTYGGDADNPVVKVFVGTNDGGIRAINGFNGKEEWIFYPQSELRKQVTLRNNPVGNHVYGVDATPSIWINDVDDDGVIEPGDGDFVRLFIGQRRGGNQIFSLDVSPTSALGAGDRDRIDAINPVYKWRIQGGSVEYPRLGQTWSQPKLASVTFGNFPAVDDVTQRTVLLFAGGYDDLQDSGYGPGGLGNAIYMADPLNGDRLLWVSPVDHAGGGDRILVPPSLGMEFPIPSELALMDSDGDSAVDRIYVGDVGGNLFRLDLEPKDPSVTSTPGIVPVLGKLATVSSDGTVTDQRKFFEASDIVQVRGGRAVASVANYDLVTIVSGNRASPLDDKVQDRFFAFRDTFIGPLPDDGLSSTDGISESYTTLQGPLDTGPVEGNLFDVTDIGELTDKDLADLQVANGYFLDLVAPGEKGLSSPIILEGKAFFTTYLPESVVSTESCSLAEGGGLLYGIDVLTGTAIFNWDGSPDSDPLSVADRTLTLGSGIPSAAVPVFLPDSISLLIGGSGGATVVDPGLKLPRARTFWFEEVAR